MPAWSAPKHTTGSSHLIRINLVAARGSAEDCPLARSTNARPLLEENPKPPYFATVLQDFTLKPLTDALDLIEHRRRTPQDVVDQLHSTQGTFGRQGRPRAHPGLLDWTAAAVAHYLAARAADQRLRQLAGLPPTYPVEHTWVVRQKLSSPDPRGASAYETTAWGRRYAAIDGSARDLWLLSFGTAKTDRPASEKATAAYVAARGEPCTGGGRHPYRSVDHGPDHPGRRLPSRVRVLDMGCGDGSITTLVDWDRHQVDQHFATDAKAVLAKAVEGAQARPGSSCVTCKALTDCDVLPQAPNLLPITLGMQPRKRRSVSISDLRSYATCPAQYHLTRQLKLKTLRAENTAIRRGRAVDAWLNDRHQVRAAVGCRSAARPAGAAAWMRERFSLPDEDAEQGARMLAEHEAYCPLDGLGTDERVLVQHQVTCYDPELKLVWIATPDLLHTRAGGWTWRETKTSTSHLYEGEPLLQRYPQLALAVLMLNSGVLGGDLTRSRVEFELLYPDDATLEELDPSRAPVVREARKVLAGLAGPWLQDQSFEPVPGRHCTDCAALDWCRPGQAHQVAAVDPEDS